jgi:YidC/Oxa1 family membrane protein insertase
MDKNSVIGFLLVAAVIIGFSYFNRPTQEEIRQQEIEDSISALKEANGTTQSAKKAVSDKQEVRSDTLFANTLAGKKTVNLSNKDITVTINATGGEIGKVILNNYKDQEKKPLLLYSSQKSGMSFVIAGKQEDIETASLHFTPENVTDSTVNMVARAVNGGKLCISYKLHDHYLLDMEIKADSMQPYLLPTSKVMTMEWHESLKQQERGYKFENQYAALTYKKADGGTDRLDPTKEKEESLDENLDWISFKDQFFGMTMIAADQFRKVDLKSVPLEQDTAKGFLKDYYATAQVLFDPAGTKATSFKFYLGPNHFRTLQKVDDIVSPDKDLKLEHLVYLGWPLFRLINRYFTIYIFDWLTDLGLSMGIVLLLITLLLRIIVYVPTRKSVLSSAKMRVLKPKVDEINAKYPDPADNMKKQQEIMQLYSQYGVSPMGGCLPMLIQMPIWIAMFNFIPNAIELRGQSFLWVDDLSTYDPLITFSHPIWGIGDHISAFCLLFCLTNVVYSVMTMRLQKDMMSGQQASQMKIMQYMMYLMPVFFFFVFNDYSAGLNYYYFISLLFSALTMWFLRRTIDDKKLLAKLEQNYKANKENPKKLSGMAARLEALQKKQEEMMKMQEKRQDKQR